MKSTDKYIITGVELPIVVDTATGVIVYDKADTVFSAGDWPSYKSTVSGAVKAGLIKPVKDVKEPVSVRFGFTNTATPNLVTAEGLPVNIFRTDN